MKAVLLLLFALGAQARWIPYDTFRLQPVDEAERNPAFLAYRTELERALETRDRAKLLPLVSDHVRMSLRDPAKSGKAAFEAEWRLDGPYAKRSELWDRLRDVVRLGGAFAKGEGNQSAEGDEFRAPYMFPRWPERYPHLDFLAVTAKKAPVYSKPDENSRVLETLTQEIVGRFDALPNPAGWKAVRTASGATGYIRAEDARSPLDYRAVFRKEKGGWKLVLFASGDWEAHERFK